eukprot:COSAG02_NODE_876_length_16272_cov_138.802510_2_plen_114_part_00
MRSSALECKQWRGVKCTAWSQGSRSCPSRWPLMRTWGRSTGEAARSHSSGSLLWRWYVVHLHTQCGCFSTGILHRLLIVALTGGYVQMAAFIAFLLSKKVSVVNEDGEPIGEN